jgi:hypothetical protein
MVLVDVATFGGHVLGQTLQPAHIIVNTVSYQGRHRLKRRFAV